MIQFDKVYTLEEICEITGNQRPLGVPILKEIIQAVEFHKWSSGDFSLAITTTDGNLVTLNCWRQPSVEDALKAYGLMVEQGSATAGRTWMQRQTSHFSDAIW